MIVIPGPPVPQGSKAAFAYTPKGGGKPRASVVDDNPTSLKAWRSLALDTIRSTVHLPLAGPLFDKGVPVALRVRMVFPLRVEDRSAIKREEKALGWAHSDDCTPGCVHMPWHTTKPDKDKCLRALFDVLKLGRVWHDDSQCCRVEVIAYRSSDPRTEVEWVPL